MALTYEPIYTVTLTSDQNTIDITSIPATYTDLRMIAFIKLAGGPAGGVANEYFQFNGDTGSNYSRVRLFGAAANTTPSSTTATTSDSALQTFSPGQGVGVSIFDILNYAGNTWKSVLSSDSADTNGTGGYVSRMSGQWRSTAAINRITWQNAGDTYAIGTTITLYGILKA
jgi:hypothetical protein